MVFAPAYGDEIYKTYTVKTGGITIGKLTWILSLDDSRYTNTLELKSEGLLSAIYSFSGEYSSMGFVKNKMLIPKKYTHMWQTKKTTKKMDLVFNENKLKSLEQKPKEEEKIRLNVFNKTNVKDPLTAFLQIIMGEKSSLVVDGRRLYTMVSKTNEKKDENTIEIKNYINLWADHKRNDFEKIIFKPESGSTLPKEIFIYFDKRVFKLKQN